MKYRMMSGCVTVTGPPAAIWFFKQRNNTSVGAEHVAETNCYKLRLIMAVERLHDHLADSLARTHDIRRVHRLVCRNHNEFFRVVLRRRHSGFPGAEYIVFDRLVGAVLHQRHMSCGPLHGTRSPDDIFRK